MKIRVHIERVVLDSLPVTRAEGARVQAAIETELTQMIVAGGLPDHFRNGGAVARVIGPQVHFTATDRAATLGRKIARSIHGGPGTKR